MLCLVLLRSTGMPFRHVDFATRLPSSEEGRYIMERGAKARTLLFPRSRSLRLLRQICELSFRKGILLDQKRQRHSCLN